MQRVRDKAPSSGNASSDIPDYRQKQLITELALTQTNLPPHFVSTGSGKVIAIYTDYAEQQTELELYDIINGKILNTATLDCTAEFSRSFENGSILLLDASQGATFYHFSSDLAEKETVDVPIPSGRFNHDMSRYYFVDNFALQQLDLESRVVTPVHNEYNMSIASLDGIHPGNDLLTVSVCTSFYGTDTHTGILNPENGKFTALGDTIQNPVYNGETFYDLSTTMGNPPDDLTENSGNTGNPSTGSTRSVFGPGINYSSLTGTAPLKRISLPELLTQNSPSIQILENSDYAIVQHFPEDVSDLNHSSPAVLWHFGDTLRKCDLSRQGFTGLLEQAVYLPEEQLIIGCTLKDDVFTSVLVDPSYANFQTETDVSKAASPALVDTKIVSSYSEEQRWDNCPEDRKEARALADSLEEKYDIHILFDERIIRLMDNTTYSARPASDSAYIMSFLAELDQALARYPTSFLSQFRDAAGNGGIIFLLNGNYVDNAAIGGFAYMENGRYYVSIDVSLIGCTSAIYHELWHATEQYITARDPEIFAYEKWMTMNPEKFDYSYDMETNPAPDKWLLLTQNPNTPYFIDAYACTDPQEDRARMMEYAMNGVLTPKDLRNYKPLREKLQFLSDTVRMHFVCTGWDTTPWEELLEKADRQ